MGGAIQHHQWVIDRRQSAGAWTPTVDLTPATYFKTIFLFPEEGRLVTRVQFYRTALQSHVTFLENRQLS